jgi:hypothetical protein
MAKTPKAPAHSTPETAATVPDPPQPSNPNVDYDRGITYIQGDVTEDKEAKQRNDVREMATGGLPYGEIAKKVGLSLAKVEKIIHDQTVTQAEADAEAAIVEAPQYVKTEGPSVESQPKATLPADR